MSPRPLKLITLNTWCGRIHKDLMAFLADHRDVDIFCFQEISHRAPPGSIKHDQFDPSFELFYDLRNILTGHKGFFRDNLWGVFGLAIFVRKDIAVISEVDHFVHLEKEYDTEIEGRNSRNVQVVSLAIADREFHVFNFHGLWTGKGKGDTPERLAQSQKLAAVIKKFSEGRIVCGDFNLLPDTESVRIIENIPMRNLVKENGITSTRSTHYKKPEKFADYILTDGSINVKDFKVLPDVISDHSPLFLVFE